MDEWICILIGGSVAWAKCEMQQIWTHTAEYKRNDSTKMLVCAVHVMMEAEHRPLTCQKWAMFTFGVRFNFIKSAKQHTMAYDQLTRNSFTYIVELRYSGSSEKRNNEWRITDIPHLVRSVSNFLFDFSINPRGLRRHTDKRRGQQSSARSYFPHNRVWSLVAWSHNT